MSALIPFALRYWRVGLLALVGLLIAYLYIAGLRAERSLAQCREQNAGLAAAIERQNAAVEALRADGEARAREASEAAQRGRAERQRVEAEADRLRRLARRPQGPGCATPLELRELGNLL